MPLPRGVGHAHVRFAPEQFLGVEYVVYFGIFEHSVGVYARASGVERPARKRSHGRYYVAYFLFEIFGYFGYRA